ncbi:hypothetical protein H5410_061026 [Solanum commersonii]|uniref:Uncharacterized protein n=1 Tax=Solanum commersonii TaxID=4109 RepID=A0A9J5W7R2_SOLCO|nr:hypothetical protein H5410_061026 [Solanum commersonii]
MTTKLVIVQMVAATKEGDAVEMIVVEFEYPKQWFSMLVVELVMVNLVTSWDMTRVMDPVQTVVAMKKGRGLGRI